MDGAMKFRKLRIAFSASCFVASLLLIGLGVRSYYSWDTVVRTNQSVALTISSSNGVLSLTGSDPSGPYSSPPPNGTVTWVRYSLDRSDPIPGFHWTWSPTLKSLQLPYWVIIFVTAMAAAIPWLGWSNRFSLRTLLIATTLIAVVLGLIAYASR
jgi:hypothetical protein